MQELCRTPPQSEPGPFSVTGAPVSLDPGGVAAVSVSFAPNGRNDIGVRDPYRPDDTLGSGRIWFMSP